MFGTASRWLLISLPLFLMSSTARGADLLCDPAASNCRTQVLTLIQNERVGIDVGFWFMQDSRYMAEIVKRRQAGVPIRILMDPRANQEYPGNDTMLAGFAQAGIPMRKRIASGIQHWKMMLFAGQNTVEFGSANYSPDAFVPSTPYSNYVSETVFVTDDPAVVNSFKTKFDDWWVDTVSIANYANITAPLARVYPTYPIDPSMNFPPQQDYASRAVGRYNAETLKIDAIMFRITDQRHTDAIIAAHNRGVPVRLIVDNGEYRRPERLWDAWNVDRLYMAGIPVRWQGHAGDNHEKMVLLYGQNLTIFGSSNWTSASANSQQEHNYFTTKNAIFQWFATQFERMWNNEVAAETAPFAPLPPDAPKNRLPAAGSQVATPTVTLNWYGGPWAHFYDIYFGTSPDPPFMAGNLALGPSLSTTTYQTWTTPPLLPGTTYYWRVVSKTVANVWGGGPVWSFTTPLAASGNLPPGWTGTDVGAVAAAGSSSAAGGTLTLAGSGADVWGTADEFRYAYQTLTGDGEIVARVASLSPVNQWSKAGVMIRNSLSASAANAFMAVSAAKGVVFQYRPSAGAASISTPGAAATAPYWVKVVRSGNTITGYQSPNGSSWTLVGSTSIVMGPTVQIGLAVTSHTDGRLATAIFDGVSR